MPRTGSEIVLNYFSNLRNLEKGNEFLMLVPTKLTEVKTVTNDSTFNDRFKLEPLVSTNFASKVEERKWMIEEWNKRISIIKNYETEVNPLIIKSFADSYQNPIISLEKLSLDFNLIVLRRDAWKTMLSGFICEHLGVWHVDNQESVNDVKSKLNGVKIEVNENYFFYQVMTHNFLKIVHSNIQKLDPTAISLQYEDFKDDPINKLNGIFNADVPNSTILHINRFIENHEDYISNVDKLKKIYDMYSI
jgi:hypothetical protein